MERPELIKHQAANCLINYRNSPATLSIEKATRLLNDSLELFFDFYELTHSPLRETIELLCEINTSVNSEHIQLGISSLFPNLIEKLNDAFLSNYCTLYDRLFAQIITFVRLRPEGSSLDKALTHFGYQSEASLLARKRLLNHSTTKIPRSRPLQKIFFLSRVTIGADVAVTSVLIHHFKRLFPSAELILLGSHKLAQLFGGDPHIHVRSINYGRGANLLSRLETWLEVLSVIQAGVVNLRPEEFLIVDPDSRLTQLGLLPLLPKNTEPFSYLLFPSRSYSSPGIDKIGQLAATWVNHLCPNTRPPYPFLALTPEQIFLGQQLLTSLRGSDTRPVICLSFGVGGNVQKRISEEFEVNLVTALSKRAKLIIDCGGTAAEAEQIRPTLTALQRLGKKVISLNEAPHYNSLPQSPTIDALFWKGGLGSFASLISASDCYIGYDSAGQHLAAALQVPTLTVFVNSGSSLFPLRWQPYGLGLIKSIHTPPSSEIHSSSTTTELLNLILNAQEQLLSDRSPVENLVEIAVENL